MKTLQKPTQSTPGKETKKPPNKLVNYKRDSTYVIGELKDILEAAQADKQIITKIQLFRDKEYSMHQFSNWRARYPEVQRIQQLSKKIEEVIESNIITSGVSKNPAFFIFLLKNHYGYADKREVETETTHVFKVSRGAKVIDVAPKPVINKIISPPPQG